MPESNVFNMDCLQAMKDFPDKFFELAIVDPPYGINAPNMQMGSNPNRKKQPGGGGAGLGTAVKLKKGRLNTGGGHMKNSHLVNMSCAWDFQKPDKRYFEELKRISVNQIIWGGNYFDLPATRCVVCWDKLQPWENFSQWEMAWTSFDKPASLFRFSNTGGANDHNKIHPTQKPIALYKWLISRYAQKGDKILDTHMGSGTNRIAAYKMGFDFWGYEIDQNYFNDSCALFNKAISQPLFEQIKPEQGTFLI